jgi:hypothetical protein
MSPAMITCLRAMAKNLAESGSPEACADGRELDAMLDAMQPGRSGRPVVPWLPDHPLYVVLAEFDNFPRRGPRFICDQYGIPRESGDHGGPIVWESRLDLTGAWEAAKNVRRAAAVRYGNTAIARLEIVEATIGDGP